MERELSITILYSELADYSLACFRALKDHGARIQLIHWSINPEAPFQFDLSFVDDHSARDAMGRDELISRVKGFKPSLVLCSGWMDRDYVAACRELRKTGVVTVLSLDNHWRGSLKQQVARMLAPITLRTVFQKAFVPGEVQKRYALKLGFKASDVQTGFYSADVERFNQFYMARDVYTESNVPKRFLYLGRYVEHKGIFELWEAFRQYRDTGGKWELWCVGTGELYDARPQIEGVKHFGFVQPGDLLPILKETSVYILPSHVEPWGVSVHEMAVAGFPMLLSNAIGAGEQFLKQGVNGFEFNTGSIESIVQLLERTSGLSDPQLLEMSRASHNLGMELTPKRWVEKLISLLS